jgi:nucleotide-binding universal stress UspA family protein
MSEPLSQSEPSSGLKPVSETEQVSPEAVEPVATAGIVVGHDGSKGADEALATALRLADDLQVPLTVVQAWSIANAPRPQSWTFGYVPSLDELAEAVRDELVRRTTGLVRMHPTVTVDYRVYNANAAKCLIEASRKARMLVVGSRGLGGFAEMVLGSVSDQCVRDAACPVLVTKTAPTD